MLNGDALHFCKHACIVTCMKRVHACLHVFTLARVRARVRISGLGALGGAISSNANPVYAPARTHACMYILAAGPRGPSA